MDSLQERLVFKAPFFSGATSRIFIIKVQVYACRAFSLKLAWEARKMQNVFPARELYNSNPCRDMWDSEQLNQMAGASGSQGSQNSSSDMFSQSRMSQIKGFSSFDVWSQPTNTQQLPEDEPVKYYMKYLTKPPLFPESERQTQKKQKYQATASYKELIEIQKKKTEERDDRDTLDSFISLLKDYTKEVKTALDLFKDSIDTTLASKAEQVATAASQSADLIKKLKDDLLESFACLRKDLKENQELKEVISKQNETIAEQDSCIKMLQSQLRDCLAREVKSIEKHEKHMEKQDKVLQKLDEINSRQTSTEKELLLQRFSTVADTGLKHGTKCVQENIEDYAPQNPPNTAFQNHFAWNSIKVPSGRLHHMAPETQPGPHPSIQNIPHLDGSNYRQEMPSLDCQYHPQLSLPPTSEEDSVVPCLNIQCQSNVMPLATQHQSNVPHPTAAIAPMRPVSIDNQEPSLQQERNTTEQSHVILQGEQAVSPLLVEVLPVSKKYPEEAANREFTSPGVRAPTLTNAAWPKQSPIAAVHPQIRVKKQLEEEKLKASGHPCANRGRREDPFDIFVFDLTCSPEEEICQIQKTKRTSLKTDPQSLVNIHRTRSKTISPLKNTSGKKTTVKTAESNGIKSHGRSKSATNSYLPKKSSSSQEGASSLHENLSPTSKHKGANENDNTDRCNGGTSTPNRPAVATLKNGIPTSKISQSVFQRAKTSFKRNLVSAKRKLSFDASELFDGFEDETSLQQITESIRMHAQRKKLQKYCSQRLESVNGGTEPCRL